MNQHITQQLDGSQSCCLPVYVSRTDRPVSVSYSEGSLPLHCQALILPLYPVTFHQGVETCEISSVCLGMLTVVGLVQVCFRQPSCWDFMGVPMTSRRHHLTACFLVLWFLQSSRLVPWVLGVVVLYICQLGPDIPQSVVLCILISCRFL